MQTRLFGVYFGINLLFCVGRKSFFFANLKSVNDFDTSDD